MQRYVDGVVCRKNVAHKQMKTRLSQPHLLILGCAVEYEREEYRFASMDVLLDQVLYRLYIGSTSA